MNFIQDLQCALPSMKIDRAITLERETVENSVDSKTGLRAKRKQKKSQLIGPCHTNCIQFGRSCHIMMTLMRMRLQRQIEYIFCNKC